MTRSIQGWSILPLSGLATALFLSCMASPPQTVMAFDGGTVRAADTDEASEVQGLLAELRPALLALVPDTAFEDIDVWVQDKPSLYRFPTEATADAEGLWSAAHRRIMLSRNADDVRRTLAHELVHAALGETWSALPGTLEEGLADHASTKLADAGAARLRAGRLSAAALAAGGIELVLAVDRKSDAGRDIRRGWSARVRLTGDESDPLDVFRLSAGLSTTKLATAPKRGYYGLAFLVVDRIVARYGYDGLNALCTRAAEEGHDHVPAAWLMAAAELTKEREDWRIAAQSAMGPAELIELVEMYPDFLVDALVAYLERLRPDGPVSGWLDSVEVRVSFAESDQRVALSELATVRAAVQRRLSERVEVASVEGL
ncbi:MAG: hypothetical protein R3F49_00535 [Planctomycetota bacterium]